MQRNQRLIQPGSPGRRHLLPSVRPRGQARNARVKGSALRPGGMEELPGHVARKFKLFSWEESQGAACGLSERWDKLWLVSELLPRLRLSPLRLHSSRPSVTQLAEPGEAGWRHGWQRSEPAAGLG